MDNFANAQVPQGLRGHPGLYDIFVLLCSGWTVPRTASVITRKYHIATKASDVAEYLHNIPPDAFLEPASPERQDFVIDYVYEMNEVLGLMKQRLCSMMLLEEYNNLRDQGFNKIAKLYFEMLIKYAAALERLRITPQLRDTMPEQAVQQPPSLRELMEGESARAGDKSNLPKLLGPGDKGTRAS